MCHPDESRDPGCEDGENYPWRRVSLALCNKEIANSKSHSILLGTNTSRCNLVRTRTMLKTIILSFLIAASVITGRSLAQVDSAQIVLEQFIRDLQQQDWEGCAKLTHPKTLGQLKRILSPLIRPSFLPEEDSLRFSAFFDGAKTADEAKSLDSVRFCIGVMNFVSNLNDQGLSVLARLKLQVLGHVDEPPNKRQFVCRISDFLESKEPEVVAITLESYRNRWLVAIPLNWKSMSLGEWVDIMSPLFH